MLGIQELICGIQHFYKAKDGADFIKSIFLKLTLQKSKEPRIETGFDNFFKVSFS